MSSFNLSKSLFLFFFFIFSSTNFAEELEYKILKKRNNILKMKNQRVFRDYGLVLMNRGTSDMVYKGNHNKFFREGKFLFRGLCLEADLFSSLWLRYNTFSEPPEPGTLIKAKRLQKYFIPLRVKNYLSMFRKSTPKMFKELKTRKVGKEDNEKIFASDDQNKKGKDKESIPVEGRKNNVKVNPNEFYNPATEKFETVRGNFFELRLGPIVTQTVPKTLDMNFSLLYEKQVSRKNLLRLGYQYEHRTERPKRSQYGDDLELLSSNSHELQAFYETFDFLDTNSVINYFYFNRAKTADTLNGTATYSPAYLIRLMPLGYKVYAKASSFLKEFSLAYGPTISVENFEYIKNNQILVEDELKFRHGLLGVLHVNPTYNLSMKLQVWFFPLQQLSPFGVEVADSGPSEYRLNVDYKLGGNISFGLQTRVIWNQLQTDREGLPSTNIINSVNMSYLHQF